jgi:hypothetical protein
MINRKGNDQYEISHIVVSNHRIIRRPITIETMWSKSGNTVRVNLWIQSDTVNLSGTGVARGMGYDKRAVAARKALESMGRTVPYELDGLLTAHLIDIARELYPDATDIAAIE